MSRTGTKSLAAALNLLGIRTRWYPSDYQTYFYDIVQGHYRLRVVEEYDAIADTPAVPFYPHFDKLYPGSKFILTIDFTKGEGWQPLCKFLGKDTPEQPFPKVNDFGHERLG